MRKIRKGLAHSFALLIIAVLFLSACSAGSNNNNAGNPTPSITVKNGTVTHVGSPTAQATKAPPTLPSPHPSSSANSATKKHIGTLTNKSLNPAQTETLEFDFSETYQRVTPITGNVKFGGSLGGDGPFNEGFLTTDGTIIFLVESSNVSGIIFKGHIDNTTLKGTGTYDVSDGESGTWKLDTIQGTDDATGTITNNNGGSDTLELNILQANPSLGFTPVIGLFGNCEITNLLGSGPVIGIETGNSIQMVVASRDSAFTGRTSFNGTVINNNITGNYSATSGQGGTWTVSN